MTDYTLADWQQAADYVEIAAMRVRIWSPGAGR